MFTKFFVKRRDEFAKTNRLKDFNQVAGREGFEPPEV